MTMIERIAAVFSESWSDGHTSAEECARKVVKAMREPTEHMIHVGKQKATNLSSEKMYFTYQSMIDTILTEDEK